MRPDDEPDDEPAPTRAFPAAELLVQQAASGDATAVEALLVRYQRDLAAYVGRHAGRLLQQKESRSDLVQSVCREVLEDLRTAAFEYRGERQFRQWLYQAALHKIRSRGRYFAADRRNAARELPADVFGSSDGPADTRTPSQSAAVGEELQRFRRELERLDETSRRVVEWVYLEELPHREVAERLGMSEAHSRVVLSRALARIARAARAPET